MVRSTKTWLWRFT